MVFIPKFRPESGEIVKVAFVGKGGSGKTTLSSLFVRHLAEQGSPVVAVDADINQHLGVALGLDDADAAKVPALGAHLDEIKEHLRGDNPRITSTQAMVKTTPPGRGSRLLDLDPEEALLRRFATRVDGVHHLATGEFDESEIGVSCYHGKTGAVELYLNHLLDGAGEYVVVDMTAGADAFASGLFTRFDLTCWSANRRGAGSACTGSIPSWPRVTVWPCGCWATRSPNPPTSTTCATVSATPCSAG
jgi:CO dehydrogenase maturation factor